MENLTIESLKTFHPSKTRNPLIAGIFYRAGFIEKFGSGIERIIGPEFIEECGGFSVKFRKEFAELNKRQNKALQIIKDKGTVTNSEYQAITGLGR